MGVFQTIDDVVRTAANGMTFGLADKLEGQGAAERSAAARARLGGFGDVVNGAATLVPIAKGPQILGLGFNGIKAAAAAPMVARVAAPILAHPVKAAALGLALPMSAGLSYANRTGNEAVEGPAPKAQREAPAAAAATDVVLPPQPHAKGTNLSIYSDAGRRWVHDITMARAAAAGGGKPDKAAPAVAAPAATPEASPFASILNSFAGEGGGISLNELAVLSQSHNQGRPALPRSAPKPPTAKDIAGQRVLEHADAMFSARLEQIAGMTDNEAKQKAYQSAALERLATIQSVLNVNQIDEAVGGAIEQQLGQ